MDRCWVPLESGVRALLVELVRARPRVRRRLALVVGEEVRGVRREDVALLVPR